MTIDSLDDGLIHRVIEGGIRRGRLSDEAKNDSTPTILSRLKLTQNGAVRNSAAVLFGKDLTDYPQVLLRLARFRGVDKSEFIDNRQPQMSIITLIVWFGSGKYICPLNLELYIVEALAIPYDASYITASPLQATIRTSFLSVDSWLA